MHTPPRLDTARLRPHDSDRLGHAGWIEDGCLVAIHVTGNPAILYAALDSPLDLPVTYGQRIAELGGGLYVSGVPQLWVSRATNRFSFLDTLDRPARERLAGRILEDRHVKSPGYLTESERDVARRDLQLFVETGQPGFITFLDGQPYNVRYWEPDFLEPLAIAPGPRPAELVVRARGVFADCTDASPSEIRELRHEGLAGAFHRNGFSTVAQAVVWRKNALVAAGDWRPQAEAA